MTPRRALRQGLLAALLGTGLCSWASKPSGALVGYGYAPDLLGDFLPAKRHIAHHLPPAGHRFAAEAIADHLRRHPLSAP
ncbi:MAG: hypothetical protein VX293_04075 [Candidatus Latescibacterota bacterium]|nr:hypothetical protein [Candidatus Latescibacterota bacterium]